MPALAVVADVVVARLAVLECLLEEVQKVVADRLGVGEVGLAEVPGDLVGVE